MYLCKLQLQNTLFHFIQAAGHHPVYAIIDHTKKGPIPAPPSEHFAVKYASVCSGGEQNASTHSCECGTACTCGQEVYTVSIH